MGVKYLLGFGNISNSFNTYAQFYMLGLVQEALIQNITVEFMGIGSYLLYFGKFVDGLLIIRTLLC